jgi:hypothetical protein
MEGSNHFGSYIHSLSLHFFKRLFPGLPMTSIVIKLLLAKRNQAESQTLSKSSAPR